MKAGARITAPDPPLRALEAAARELSLLDDLRGDLCPACAPEEPKLLIATRAGLADALDAVAEKGLPITEEYRVVWQRAGCRRKTKSFVRRAMAERFLRWFGPEPWTVHSKDPDEMYCCDGYQCSCGGLTVREQHEQYRASLPALEWVRLERREVGAWAEDRRRHGEAGIHEGGARRALGEDG